MTFLSGVWLIASIELRQRVRGVAWYVLLGVFVLLTLIVTGLTWLVSAPWGGSLLYSMIIAFVLLLGTLVTPALSGSAINGDRDAGTLATTQVTLVSTAQLVLGKFAAAWISALAFLAAALPFVLFAFALSGVQVATVLVSLLVLVVELGVLSAVGVGLSGVLRRPLFSVVVSYLVVAMLSIGTLIAFALGGFATQSTQTTESSSVDWSTGQQVITDGPPAPEACTMVNRTQRQVPRFDRVWWLLAANPYVVLADATPTTYDESGNVTDLFGTIKLGVRAAQTPPELQQTTSECEPSPPGPSTAEIIGSTTPSWAVGLGIHAALAGALLWGAIASTATPARRMTAGSRIA